MLRHSAISSGRHIGHSDLVMLCIPFCIGFFDPRRDGKGTLKDRQSILFSTEITDRGIRLVNG